MSNVRMRSSVTSAVVTSRLEAPIVNEVDAVARW